jgi:O-antigen/teichoic acid export membrane protein
MPGAPEETPEALGQATAGTVVGGTLWSILQAVMVPIQTIVVSVVAARVLSTDAFSQQSLIAFVSVSATWVFAARMPAALQRFGAQLAGAGQLGMLRTLYQRTFHIQIVVGLIICGGFAILSIIGAAPPAAWVVAGVATLAAVVQAAPSSLLISVQRWRETVLPGSISNFIATIVMVVVLLLGGGVTGYFLVEAAVYAANLLWTWRLAHRVAVVLPPAEPIEVSVSEQFRTFIRASTFFAFVEFVVLNRSEILFLDRYSTAAQIGAFSIAFAASEVVARFPQILTTVSLPAVANLHGAGEHDKVRNGFWRALRFLAATCPVIVVAAAAFGSDLVGIVYGPRYVAAEPVLVILLIPYMVLPMMGLSDALLWTFGRIRFLVVCGIAATVVDIVAALILVPRYDAIGGAVASDLAALTAGVPGLWLTWRLMAPAVFDSRVLLHNLAVTLTCAATSILPVVLIGGVRGLIVGGVLTAMAVAGLATKIGILSDTDAAWLDEAMGERIGGRVGLLIWRLAFSPT